ncbi:efflux RND transporter periplasmic adaptor subunit [Labilithrix luteola]|uniref:efflux RND transporter periplasmic adaptor subunit n=1 Tax=Labilithrix luteola TaxID=1391654 RepID=UPI001474D437|nr:efflux RND transporter periplasmic adaptor subunit [Labilithrix luteola]
MVAGLVAAVAIGGGAYAMTSHKAHAPTAESVRDVPQREGNAIVFSDAFAKRAGVKIDSVRRAPLVPTIRVVGTVTFDPARVAAVGTRLRGVVRKTAKYEGDEVKVGDVLTEIDSAELGEAQATLLTNRAQAEAAEVNAKREKSLLDRQLTTAREAEVADTTLRSQSAMLSASEQRVRALGGNTGPFGVHILKSPIAGHVVERHVQPGQAVEANVTAYKIADLSRLWIELAVTEQSLGAVRRGDRVSVAPVSDPTKAIIGRVGHVGEVIDLSTRTADVRIEVDNTERLLRVGQSVFATIDASGPAHEALLVPRDAVVFVDGKPTAFRAESTTRVVPIALRLGAANESDVEILEGLGEHDKVVSGGAFYLKSELFR